MTTGDQIDVAVIGAGVTGLACARAVAMAGCSVCVLERHPRAGLDTSTHNSGVIHAGLYYPPGSLKARLCVEGRHLLYEFCAAHGVPHRRTGKLVVAHETAEVGALEALCARGTTNGAEGLTLVDRAFIVRREPAVNAVAALWSPETGIVDAEALVKALLRSGIDAGVIFLPGTRLEAAAAGADAIVLSTARETIHARVVVNAAGLYADDVSAVLGGEAFTIYPARGEYAELVPAKRALVNGLVYPTPDAHGLGVHLVKTTGGQVWLGPTVRFQRRKDDYESDRLSIAYFAAAVRRLIDGVDVNDLRLAGSGIRAKLHPESEPFADFMIRRDRRNPRVVHAAGIESPGLTSCLAIGQLVSRVVLERI
jgi:L-2-hydroxyglutarate oxidase LhgO